MAPLMQKEGLALSSKTVHGDDSLNTERDVGPSIHVSTTFRYPKNPDQLMPIRELKGKDLLEHRGGHIYSRESNPNTTRLEEILVTVLGGRVLTYASGLAAFHAMLVFLNPKRVAIRGGYHGCHGVIGLHAKMSGMQVLDLDCAAEELQPGDVVHVETPLNPTGEVRNLAAYAAKARPRGAILTVDATFAPPPLMDPFALGADIVMHSGTKYLGGHSDMLCGVLAISAERVAQGWYGKMFQERVYLGSVMGSLEGWLGVRSVRTLELRVQKQSQNVGFLVGWLEAALDPSNTAAEAQMVRKVVETVQHGSLQHEDIRDGWLLKQMPNGFSPVFAITMKEEIMARQFPTKLSLFYHATSLGGIESLIEWRAMSDPTVDPRLLRVSIGIEGWEDLRDDLLQGFKDIIAS